MRCPHCRGEIPQESKFCGVCGQNVHVEHVGTPPQAVVAHTQAPSAGDQGLSPSLFELPVSKGARAVRVGMITALNLLMLGGAVALFMGYLHKRDRAAAGPEASVRSSAKPTEAPSAAPPIATTDAGNSVSPKEDSNKAPENIQKTESETPANSPAPPRVVPDAGLRTSGSAASGPSGTPNEGPTASPAPASPPRLPDAGTPPPTSSRPTRAGSDAGPGPATVEAALTEEEQARQVQILAGKIGLVVERNQAQLSRCYENALKQAPRDPLEGRIDLHFSIQPDGSVRGIRVRSNSTGSKSLATCLVGIVGSWTFPSSGSEALDFVWPFEFQSPK